MIRIRNSDKSTSEGGSFSRIDSFLNSGMAKEIPLNILLAEDNAINQMFMLKILELMGYKADVVSNGREVLDALNERHYDIILMDIQMPEMSGLEAVEHICNLYSSKQRPKIIAITGHVLVEEIKEHLSRGVDDHIGKPIDPRIVQSKLIQWGKNTNMDTGSSDQGDSRQRTETLDVKTLKTTRKLGDRFFTKVKNKFFHLAPNLILKMKESGENQEIIELSHQLRGMCSNVGAEYMRELCSILEKRSSTGSRKEVNALIEQLESAFRLTRGELERLSLD